MASGAGEADEELLRALCEAAARSWAARLRPGVTPRECEEAFCCAAAFTAAANLSAGGAGGAASFTAGEISVRVRGDSASSAHGAELLETAERLMAPYAESGGFCFKGVPG